MATTDNTLIRRARRVVGTPAFRVRYDSTKFDPIRSREVRPMLRRLELDTASSVLDLGTGIGTWTEHLRRRVPRAVGVDVEPGIVEFGRRVYPKADLRVADGERLPFDDGEFDRVVFISTLEHIHNPDDALAEVARVLAPGGLLAMSADTLNHPAWLPIRDEHAKRSVIEHFFSREDLIRLAAEHGLRHEWGSYIYGSAAARQLLRPRLAGNPLHWAVAPLVRAAGVLDAEDSGFMYQAVYRRVAQPSS